MLQHGLGDGLIIIQVMDIIQLLQVEATRTVDRPMVNAPSPDGIQTFNSFTKGTYSIGAWGHHNSQQPPHSCFVGHSKLEECPNHHKELSKDVFHCLLNRLYVLIKLLHLLLVIFTASTITLTIIASSSLKEPNSELLAVPVHDAALQIRHVLHLRLGELPHTTA